MDIDLNDLTGPQRKVVREAFLAAFNQASLNRLVVQELDKMPLDVVVAPGPFGDMVFDLINLAQMEGWLSDLIKTAQQTSGNPKVRNLESTLYLIEVERAPANSRHLIRGSLERTVRERAGFDDFVLWADRLIKLRSQICRIEYPTSTGTGFGTAFLVASDLLLTNYHVVANHHRPKLYDPATIRCRFDFASESGGENPGKTCSLASGDGWLVDFSPPSDVDPGDNGGMPRPDQLDYALLRLAEPVGEQAVNGAPRGWISVLAEPAAVAAADILFIVQHPKGDPLKLAVGAVLDWNANRTRLRYDANTEPGSSGSPCFDSRLQLVALHHAGDPDYFQAAKYNQGIPMGAIVAQLADRADVSRFWS